MNHTKGPWEVSKDGYSIHAPKRSEQLYVAQTHPFDPDQEANAHLIAAAPDLLRACKKLVEIAPKLWGDDPDEYPVIMNRFEAAIALAEGA